jgi:hypothetical protein
MEFGGKYLNITVRRHRLLCWVPIDRLLQGCPSIAVGCRPRFIDLVCFLLCVRVCRRPTPVPLPLVWSIESAQEPGAEQRFD